MSLDKTSLFRKIFWALVMPVVAVLFAKYCVLRFYDRPVTITPPTEDEIIGRTNASRDDGLWVDYRALFDKRQEREATPVRENGWRDVVLAWGARAYGIELPSAFSDESRIAENPALKERYEKVWKPSCQFLEIDPNETPRYGDRLDLRSYVAKYGVDGSEPGSANSRALGDFALYWEQGQRKIGRVTNDAVVANLKRLESNPWTRTQFPVAARWFHENEDLCETLARAARASKFCAPRFPNPDPCAVERTDTSDLEGVRKIGSIFIARANYNVGSGKIAEAVDDVETVLRLARFLLDSNNKFLSDRLVGLNLIEKAASIGVFANRSRQPTKEESARWNQVWNDFATSYDFELAYERSAVGLLEIVLLPTAQDACLYRRETGSVASLWAKLTDKDEWKERARSEEKLSRVQKTFLLKSSFDDCYVLESLANSFATAIEATARGEDYTFSTDVTTKDARSSRRAAESNLVASLLVGAQKPLIVTRDEFRRVAALVNMRGITGALLTYQLERGSLPPAYTVDALGKPLQSWRTLILPYLGEAERALSEKIDYDQPWDSAKNETFKNETPRVFQRPFDSRDDVSLTCYSTILGQDALFGYGGAVRNLDELRFRDGVYTNLQALIVERRLPVCWTRPDDELDASLCRRTFGRPDGVLETSANGELNVGSASGAAVRRGGTNSNGDASALIELLISGR